MGDSAARIQEIRYALARDRARGLLALTRQRPPFDIEAIIERAGVPMVEQTLGDGVRATIGDVAGRRAIILNRHYRVSSPRERRWILAEELGHVLLGHKLTNSTVPGRAVIGLLEDQRLIYEREARAFAAELLMPFAEVSRRWFALSFGPAHSESSLDERVQRLAEEFDVTPAAMRVRLQQMKIVGQQSSFA